LVPVIRIYDDARSTKHEAVYSVVASERCNALISSIGSKTAGAWS